VPYRGYAESGLYPLGFTNPVDTAETGEETTGSEPPVEANITLSDIPS